MKATVVDVPSFSVSVEGREWVLTFIGAKYFKEREETMNEKL